MATLKTNTLTGTSTAGSIAVTGEGNSTTTNLQQGLCKVWVNYTGISTTAERDSFNVTSLTDAGTGQTTINIANDMANANYSGFFYSNANTSSSFSTFSNAFTGGWGDLTTGAFKNNAHNSSGSVDSFMNVTGVMGDLA